LEGSGYDVLLFGKWWEIRDFREASVDIDWTCDFGCAKEDGPSFFTEAANEKGFGFFGTMLEGGGSKADVFLKGVPVG
jgi:hypothetical protein